MTLTSAYLGDGVSAKVANSRGSGLRRDDNVSEIVNLSHIVRQVFTSPSTIVTNGIVTSHAGAAVAGTTTPTLNGSLASGGVATLTPARNVVITVTHGSAVVAMSGTITGTRFGRTVTEAWSVTAGGTTKTFTGAVAFDTVTSISEVVAGDASTNTIIVGNGKVLGLQCKCAVPRLVHELENTSVPTAGVVVAASDTANADARGTYTPNSTLNGSLSFTVWYVVNDLTTLY